MAMAAKPPTTAGSSARASRAAPRRAAVVEPEHGAQHPGQAGVAEQQRPLADDEPLGYVRVPAVEHGGGQAGEHGLAVQERGRARAGQHEDQQQDQLLHDVGREQAGRDGDGEVARHRPRRPAGQPEHRRGERLAGHEHHVVAEQEPAPQPGAEREQPQDEPDGEAWALGGHGAASRGDHDGPVPTAERRRRGRKAGERHLMQMHNFAMISPPMAGWPLACGGSVVSCALWCRPPLRKRHQSHKRLLTDLF